MNASTRLDSISRAVGNAFHRASDHARRQAVLAACRIAVCQTDLQGEEIDAAFELLRQGGDGTALQNRLENLSEAFDDEYFRLSEAGDHASNIESLRQFGKARAAAALAVALSSESGGLHEAIYEAIIASDNREEVVRAVELTLAEKK